MRIPPKAACDMISIDMRMTSNDVLRFRSLRSSEAVYKSEQRYLDGAR